MPELTVRALDKEPVSVYAGSGVGGEFTSEGFPARPAVVKGLLPDGAVCAADKDVYHTIIR
jgi:hypothetical protein